MIESSLPQSEPVLLPDRPFGQQVRSVIGYSLLAALMMITPLLVFLPAVLLHCAIRNGRRAAWAVLVLSVAIAFIFYAPAAASPDEGKMAWSFLMGISLAIVLPAVAAIPMVERGESFGRVLVFLIAGAAIGLAATEITLRLVLSFSPYAAHIVQAKQTSAELLKLFHGRGFIPSSRLGEAQQQMGGSLMMLPATMLSYAGLVFILSLLMLGRLPAWRQLAARSADPNAAGVYLFRNLVLPDWLLFAFIFGGLTPLVTGLTQKVAANTLGIVGFLYVMQGLAVFRSMLLSIGARVAGTLFGWGLLVLSFPFSVLALGVAGLFDSFFDFRHFKKRKDDSHESHSD